MPAKATSKKAKKATVPTTDLIRRVTWDRAIAKKKNLPDFRTGDTVGVYVKVKEGEKERVQLYSGVVLKVQGTGIGRTFTVRKIASGVGVERTFPVLSPVIDRVEIISRGKVRRSRLFYLRGLRGRSARLDSEAYFSEGVGAADEVAGEASAAEGAAASSAEAPKAEAKAESKAPAKDKAPAKEKAPAK
jgi:large subunit ribosomal protein L19